MFVYREKVNIAEQTTTAVKYFFNHRGLVACKEVNLKFRCFSLFCKTMVVTSGIEYYKV